MDTESGKFLDRSMTVSTSSLPERNDRGCSLLWKIAAGTLSLILVVLVGFVAYKAGQSNPSQKEDTSSLPSSEQLQQGEVLELSASVTRVLRVKGETDPCVSPYCRDCSIRVHREREPEHTQLVTCNADVYPIQKGTPSCYNCASECLNYSRIESLDRKYSCNEPKPFLHPEHRCCILATLANMDNHCNGGKSFCEKGSATPICNCPPGKTGPQCLKKTMAEIPIPCNCHVGVDLCEDSLPPCDSVIFNTTTACQMSYKSMKDNNKYTCYCNNTELADHLESCYGTDQMSDKLTNMGASSGSPLLRSWLWTSLLSLYIIT